MVDKKTNFVSKDDFIAENPKPNPAAAMVSTPEVGIPEGIKHPKVYREAIRTTRSVYPFIVKGSQQEINIATDIYNIRLRHPQKTEE